METDRQVEFKAKNIIVNPNIVVLLSFISNNHSKISPYLYARLQVLCVNIHSLPSLCCGRYIPSTKATYLLLNVTQ